MMNLCRWQVCMLKEHHGSRLPWSSNSQPGSPFLKGPDNASDHMRERARLMFDASEALWRGLGVKLKHLTVHCRSTQAFCSSERAGLKFRPALLQPEAVCFELSLQAMLHPLLMGERATQWKWRPQLMFLPPVLYKAVFLDCQL